MPKEKLKLSFRCNRCGSAQTYYRRMKKERVCKICGNIQKDESDG